MSIENLTDDQMNIARETARIFKKIGEIWSTKRLLSICQTRPVEQNLKNTKPNK